jgi:hypothetical protein
MWSEATVQDDKYYRKGTENFAQRLGMMLINRQMIPAIYFLPVVREGSADISPVIPDVPRQKEITAKYARLRKEFEVMRAQRDIQHAEEAERIGIPESEIEIYVNEDTDEGREELTAYLTEPANDSLTEEEAAECDDSVHVLNPERDLYFARQEMES